MKHLPKHLRPRWRYLAVAIETWPDADVDRSAFQRALWFAAGNLLGDAASASLQLSVMRFELDRGSGHAVIRVRRGRTDEARAALACVDAVDGHDVGLTVRGTSGTVRACSEKYLGRDPEVREHSAVAFEGADRAAVQRNGRYDVRVSEAYAGAAALDVE
jgi:ribonuclease P/MRP protein subunit POP5